MDCGFDTKATLGMFLMEMSNAGDCTRCDDDDDDDDVIEIRNT